MWCIVTSTTKNEFTFRVRRERVSESREGIISRMKMKIMIFHTIQSHYIIFSIFSSFRNNWILCSICLFRLVLMCDCPGWMFLKCHFFLFQLHKFTCFSRGGASEYNFNYITEAMLQKKHIRAANEMSYDVRSSNDMTHVSRFLSYLLAVFIAACSSNWLRLRINSDENNFSALSLKCKLNGIFYTFGSEIFFLHFCL